MTPPPKKPKKPLTGENLGVGTMRRQVYDNLRSGIESGELPPGTALPYVPAMAKQLNTSQSTVRAAIQVLRNEGYLKTGPGMTRTTVIGIPNSSAGAEVKEVVAAVSALTATLDMISSQLTTLAKTTDVIGSKLITLVEMVQAQPKGA